MTREGWILTAGAAAFAWWWFNPPPGHVTTSETYDLDSIGATNYPEPIKRFARAIAHAEGYGIPGAIPTVANNPGDLALPGWSPTMGSARISVFESAEQGWWKLYRQLGLIVSGSSAVYSLDDTIRSMGNKWAGGDPNWARNVSNHLGVSIDAPLWSALV